MKASVSQKFALPEEAVGSRTEYIGRPCYCKYCAYNEEW